MTNKKLFLKKKFSDETGKIDLWMKPPVIFGKKNEEERQREKEREINVSSFAMFSKNDIECQETREVGKYTFSMSVLAHILESLVAVYRCWCPFQWTPHALMQERGIKVALSCLPRAEDLSSPERFLRKIQFFRFHSFQFFRFHSFSRIVIFIELYQVVRVKCNMQR